VQPVATNSPTLQYLVPGTGHHQHLAKTWIPLNVAGLLQEIGPDASGGLAEELRDVEDTEVGPGSEPGRQLGTSDVEPRTGGDPERLEIQEAGGEVGQSSPALPKPIGPGEKRISEPLDADSRVRSMPAADHDRIR